MDPKLDGQGEGTQRLTPHLAVARALGARAQILPEGQTEWARAGEGLDRTSDCRPALSPYARLRLPTDVSWPGSEIWRSAAGTPCGRDSWMARAPILPRSPAAEAEIALLDRRHRVQVMVGAERTEVSVSSATVDGRASMIGPDQAAFYRQNVDRLFKMALMRCRNWQMAEDLVHDVFVKLFRKWPELKSPITSSYAARALVNCHVDEIRRRQARVSEVHDDVDQLLPADGPSPPGPSDRDAEVRDAVRALPEQQRNVIYYVYYEGLSLAETAKVMRLGPRTVHNYHSLAKQKLESGLAHLARSVKESRDER
jgi:RNA polymerase sigma factor (sigma-70 family)